MIVVEGATPRLNTGNCSFLICGVSRTPPSIKAPAKPRTFIAVAINPSLPNQIRSLYEASGNEVPAPSRNEMLIREAALVTRFYAPDTDPARFRDLHAALLAAKDAAIASGLTRADLAARLNAVAAEYQGILAERLGAAVYERLMGVPAGERVDIIEPGLQAAVGVRRPGSAPEGNA